MCQPLLSDILIARGFPRDAFHNLPDSRSVQLHVENKEIYLRSSLKKYRNVQKTWVKLREIFSLYEFQFVDNYKYIRYQDVSILFCLLNLLPLHPSTGIELFESIEPRIPLREYMEFDFTLHFRVSIPEPYGPAHVTFIDNGQPQRSYTFFPAVFCNVDLIMCFLRC